MVAFQDYQRAFTAHLRQPTSKPTPAGVSDQRMRVYREIVFNNFYASVSACFPVLLNILGKRRFSKLARQCFIAEHFTSPLFQDIPHHFVDFLQTLDLAALTLPAYTAQLAHYEWIELALSRQIDPEPAAAPPAESVIEASELLHREVRLQSVHQLLHYDYPVQQLSKKNSAIALAPTWLLVYRTHAFDVRFIQLNFATYQLLQQLQTNTDTAHRHLLRLANTMPPAAIIDFGLQTLLTLYRQQAIVIV